MRIARNSFFLLVGSYLIGTHVLAFFGISIPVVQVGGGLVVTSTATSATGSQTRLARFLGPSAMTVIMRLSSFLLVCIGVQIPWNGLSTLLASLPLHAH